MGTEFEEGELEFGDEDLKEEIRKELTDVGIDEWTYLDNFFKRFNKVKLDHLAIEQEGKRLQKENLQLRSILKQFLDGVSVNEGARLRLLAFLVGSMYKRARTQCAAKG